METDGAMCVDHLTTGLLLECRKVINNATSFAEAPKSKLALLSRTKAGAGGHWRPFHSGPPQPGLDRSLPA